MAKGKFNIMSGTSETDDFGMTEINGKPAHLLELPPDDGEHVDFLDVASWKDRDGEWHPGAFLKAHKQRLTVTDWKSRFSRHQTFAEKAVGGGYVQGYADVDRRAKDRMVFLSIIAFDIDVGQSFEEVAERMRHTGFDAVMHTSWSHRADKDGVVADRFRIIVRLARRCPVGGETIGGPHVWKRMYRLIGVRLGLNYDEACEDASRLMFYPSCPRDSLPSARVVLLDGVGLDWGPYAAQAQTELEAEREERERQRLERLQRQSERQCALDEMEDEELDAELKLLRTHLSFIDPDIERCDWLRIIFAAHDKFADSPVKDEAMQIVIDWSAGGRKFEKDGPDEVEKIWDGASGGGGESQVTYGTLVHLAKAGGFQPPPQPLSTANCPNPQQLRQLRRIFGTKSAASRNNPFKR